MEIKGIYKQAGEPTESIPLYLCEQAFNSLSIWRGKTLQDMQQRLKADIEDLDRWEFNAVDSDGKLLAMMIVTVFENEPHTGENVLYTKFAFSTNKGALAKGYKWLKRLARMLNIKMIVTTRQTAQNKIEHVFHPVK